MYGDQFGEFVCGYWDLKVNQFRNVICVEAFRFEEENNYEDKITYFGKIGIPESFTVYFFHQKR